MRQRGGTTNASASCTDKIQEPKNSKFCADWYLVLGLLFLWILASHHVRIPPRSAFAPLGDYWRRA